MNELKDYSPEDFAKIPLTDLNAIQANLAKGIELRKVADKVEWSNQLKELIKRSGFTLEELASDTKLNKASRIEKERAPAKYHNPQNLKQTWSGKGRQPNWYTEALASGITEKELLIQ